MTQDLEMTVEDGGLGISPTGNDGVSAVIGCTSTGPTDRLLITSSLKTLVATYGDGPGVEDAAYKINTTGAPVVFCRVPSSTPGAYTSVTSTGTGTGTLTVGGGLVLSGSPLDTNDGQIVITKGGTRGVAGIEFTWSMDAGRTKSPPVKLGAATTYAIPRTGITIGFQVGTYDVGDTFAFASSAPACVVGDLEDAFGLLDASAVEFGLLHLATPADSNMAAAVETLLDGAASGYMRFSRALLETRDINWTVGGESLAQWATAVSDDFAAVSGLRIGVGAGMALITSPLTLRRYRRPIAWAAHARACKYPEQRDLRRVKAGPLDNVGFGKPTDPGVMSGYWDERFQEGLDAARFITATTRIGKPGVFIKRPNMMTPPGSDFSLLQYGRVMDIAMSVVRDKLGDEIGDDVPVNPSTGLIDETAARSIEAIVNAELRNRITNQSKAVQALAVLSRTDNLISTGTLNADISLIPRAYIGKIKATLRYTNPALQALGA